MKMKKTVLVNRIDNNPKPPQQMLSESIIKNLQNQKPNVKLSDLIHGKKFCVVGNSPKELGSGNGKIIDSYDVVIRFKNYDITDEFAKDYGSRTDVWVTPFNLTQFYRDPAQYKSVCCCIPLTHSRWQKRFPANNINYDLMTKYNNIEFVPLKTFQQVWDKYEKGQPSSGMTTLYWLYKLTGKLRKKDLFGFSMFDPKETHHYFSHKENHKLSAEWAKNTPNVHPRRIESSVFNEITT